MNLKNFSSTLSIFFAIIFYSNISTVIISRIIQDATTPFEFLLVNGWSVLRDKQTLELFSVEEGIDKIDFAPAWLENYPCIPKEDVEEAKKNKSLQDSSTKTKDVNSLLEELTINFNNNKKNNAALAFDQSKVDNSKLICISSITKGKLFPESSSQNTTQQSNQTTQSTRKPRQEPSTNLTTSVDLETSEELTPEPIVEEPRDLQKEVQHSEEESQKPLETSDPLEDSDDLTHQQEDKTITEEPRNLQPEVQDSEEIQSQDTREDLDEKLALYLKKIIESSEEPENKNIKELLESITKELYEEELQSIKEQHKQKLKDIKDSSNQNITNLKSEFSKQFTSSMDEQISRIDKEKDAELQKAELEKSKIQDSLKTAQRNLTALVDSEKSLKIDLDKANQEKNNIAAQAADLQTKFVTTTQERDAAKIALAEKENSLSKLEKDLTVYKEEDLEKNKLVQKFVTLIQNNQNIEELDFTEFKKCGYDALVISLKNIVPVPPKKEAILKKLSIFFEIPLVTEKIEIQAPPVEEETSNNVVSKKLFETTPGRTFLVANAAFVGTYLLKKAATKIKEKYGKKVDPSKQAATQSAANTLVKNTPAKKTIHRNSKPAPKKK